MKLMMIVVPDPGSEDIIQELVGCGFRVTRMASTGGFLKKGNTTLMVGIENEKVDEVFALLRRVSPQAEGGQHRATVFVVDMPVFEQI
jgi:uncharacterized protein YaaQ